MFCVLSLPSPGGDAGRAGGSQAAAVRHPPATLHPLPRRADGTVRRPQDGAPCGLRGCPRAPPRVGPPPPHQGGIRHPLRTAAAPVSLLQPLRIQVICC